MLASGSDAPDPHLVVASITYVCHVTTNASVAGSGDTEDEAVQDALTQLGLVAWEPSSPPLGANPYIVNILVPLAAHVTEVTRFSTIGDGDPPSGAQDYVNITTVPPAQSPDHKWHVFINMLVTTENITLRWFFTWAT